jgi:hypothetical protein
MGRVVETTRSGPAGGTPYAAYNVHGFFTGTRHHPAAERGGLRVFVWRSFYAAIAVGLLLLPIGPAAVWADETFVCSDGSMVTVTSDNRAAMQDHPCVKAWFANDAAMRKAAEEDEAPRQLPGTLVRYPVMRAVALRKTAQRPAYLDWIRPVSTAIVRSYVRNTAASGGTRFRLVRFGRR